MRRTKVVCTLGPSSNSAQNIEALVDAGMDVARLNFSHGKPEEHRIVFDRVRRAAERRRRNVGILADLQGPKMRTGVLASGKAVTLLPGAPITLTTEEIVGDAARVSTTYRNLPDDVRPGDRILLADGTMELRVKEVDGTDVRCEVMRGGLLGEHKGINLPGVRVSAPCLTEKDLRDLACAVEWGAEFVALSFVREAEDLRRLKQEIARLCGGKIGPAVIAKIERPEALDVFDEILEETDAVMVARGDLGIESDLENIPQIQKDLIRKCNARGVPVITATQMLESMVQHAQPTRAEVSDVANAIYDGTDAVMLSAETAAGAYPIEAARVMADIAMKADTALAGVAHFEHTPLAAVGRDAHSEAIGEAVAHMARELDVRLIACFTRSGYTAHAIARFRPSKPVLAFALNELTLRQCALVWGVEAVSSLEINSIDTMVRTVDCIVLDRQLAKKGDTIIIVAGTPFGIGGRTNLLNLHTVGVNG